MQILMISTTFPYPPTLGGTEVRTFNFLKYLKQQGHQVSVVTQREHWQGDPDDTPDAEVAALRQIVDEVAIFPLPPSPPDFPGWRGALAKVGRLVQSFIHQVPAYISQRRSPAMQAWIDDRVRRKTFDVVTCEHSLNTMYIRPDYVKFARVVVNVHSSMYGALWDGLKTGTSSNPKRDQLYRWIVYSYEKKYCNQSYSLVVTTPEDRDLLKQFNAEAKITIVSNGVDLDLFPSRSQDPGGYQLIFVGAMEVGHNRDAALFFTQEVFPLIRTRYPQAQLYLVGGKPGPEVQRLASQPGVIVTGRVPSVVNYLHRSTVCVVPLRTGYGIKNKTLEAMAAGVPVVGSDRGLEGLTIEPPRVPEPLAARANTIPEYVENISQLLESPALRSQFSRAARRYVETTFTWESAGSCYERVLRGDE